MKTHVCNDNKVFPYLYIDDWYTPEEEKLIWTELDFYTNTSTLHRAEDDPTTGYHDDGSSRSQAWRVFCEGLYMNPESAHSASHFLRLQKSKILSNKVKMAMEEAGPVFRMFGVTNQSTAMINYYENDDYYDAHTDAYMISSFCWFYRTPKAFTGGDITFTDSGATTECKHNRMIVFPSYYMHSVDPIKMKEENLEMGLGRYSLVHFYMSMKKYFFNTTPSDTGPGIWNGSGGLENSTVYGAG